MAELTDGDVQQVKTDFGIMHEIAHGDANKVVETENGPVRSVAKLIADMASYITDIAGFKFEADTYAQLRAYTGILNRVDITGKDIAGIFRYDPTDTTSPDNGCTIIVTSGGKRYKRIFEGGINPIWFGGTGGADDTAAVQGALDAATVLNSHVVITGNHTCATQLRVTCSLVIRSGATLTGNLRINSSNVTVSGGGKLISNAPQAISTNPMSGSVESKLSNVTIDGIDISFLPSTTVDFREAMVIRRVDQFTVRNCYVRYGISLTGCRDFKILDNTLDGDNFQNNSELVQASLISDGIIDGNHFKDSLDNFIDLYSSGERTIVTNNRMIGNKTKYGTCIEIKVTMADDPANTSSPTNGFDQSIIVANNIIKDITPFTAQRTSAIHIYYLDSRAVPDFKWSNTIRNMIVSGNIIEGYDDASITGIASFDGIAVEYGWGMLIADNIIRNCTSKDSSSTSSAIRINGVHDSIIQGNKGCVHGGAGLSIRENCYDVAILGNNFGQDETAGHLNAFGIYFSKISSGESPYNAQRLTVAHNVLRASIDGLRALSAAGSVSDCLFVGNISMQQWNVENVNRCTFESNWIYGDRFFALSLGYSAGICAHNKVTGNTLTSPSASPKPGVQITRVRASIIKDNSCHSCNNGILVVGTNTANELDNLIIKDNISVSQTGPNFPSYSSMSAADTALLQASTNLKVA